jgi:hypothetical protein
MKRAQSRNRSIWSLQLLFVHLKPPTINLTAVKKSRLLSSQEGMPSIQIMSHATFPPKNSFETSHQLDKQKANSEKHLQAPLAHMKFRKSLGPSRNVLGVDQRRRTPAVLTDTSPSPNGPLQRQFLTCLYNLTKFPQSQRLCLSFR